MLSLLPLKNEASFRSREISLQSCQTFALQVAYENDPNQWNLVTKGCRNELLHFDSEVVCV